MRTLGLALLLSLAVCHMAAAQTKVVPPVKFGVEGRFDEADTKGKKEKKKPGGFKPAENISGIACIEGPDVARRHCLVINDQDVFAQSAIVERGEQDKPGRILPGKRIMLIGDQAPARTVGKEPDLKCTKTARMFKDLDGEAVAYAANYFYVVGSHGCSRKHDERVVSSFLLVRFKVDGDGKPQDIPDNPQPGTGVEATYRLAEVLSKTDKIKAQFGTTLISAKGKNADMGPGGLNIEGMTVIGDQLFIGLRAPSIDGKGYIVRVPIAGLFAADQPLPDATVFEVPFGKSNGVRDLVALPDGRLLVLGGATEEQRRAAYPVFLLKPSHDAVERSWDLELALHDAKGKPLEGSKPEKGKRMAKAEAMLFLGQDANALRVLVMFDGIENGGPREYRLPLN